MENKAFWNEVAKQGLLLGMVMGASKILEQSMLLNGGISVAGWILLEWVLFAVLFVAILYRATKKRAALSDPTLGYSFGQGLNYMILISIFAAVPVSCMYYVYINSIVGYDNYVEGLISVIVSAVESQPIDNNTATAIDSLIEQLRMQPQASILSTLFGTVLQYIFASLFVGLFVANFTKRKPEIFNKVDEQ